MKKQIILLLLGLMLLGCGSSVGGRSNSEKREKKVIDTAIKYNADGKFTENTVYEYDNNWNNTKNSSYSPDGKIIGLQTMEYDSNNKLIKSIKSNGFDIISESVFEYNTNWQNTKININTNGKFTPSGYVEKYTYILEYDNDDKFKKGLFYDNNNLESSYTLPTYDINNNLVKESIYNPKNNSLIVSYIYSYDNEKNKISEQLFNGDGTTIYSITYNYKLLTSE